MRQFESMLIVLTTVPDQPAGEILAEELVGASLAACVQILPRMTSIYIWEGKVQKEGEHLLLIKTLPQKWDQVRSLISANHPYDVPEIVAIDAEKVSEPYLAWMNSVFDG